MKLPTPPIMEDNTPRKGYGLSAKKGFNAGMNTVPYVGQGLQLALNVVLKNSQLHKMTGNTEFQETASIDEVIKLGEYQKSDGSFQAIKIYKSGAVWKFRAIKEDGTVVVPTTDVDFTSSVFGWTQIALTGYLSNKVATSTAKESFLWDGEELTAVANSNDNPEWISSEGRRQIMIHNGIVSFSRSDQNPITSFTGGTGADTEGEYRVNIPGNPIGAYPTGTGTLIGFNTGFELHNIVETDDGSAVFNETRSKQFQYKGDGIDDPHKVAIGKFYAYAVTNSGLQKIHPQTGESVNLVDEDSGKIKDYWDTFDLSNAQAVYSPKEEMICVTLCTDSTGINDIILCYHEPTKAFTLKSGNFTSIAVVNRQLLGGSSNDGKVFKVFDDSTYQDGFGGDTKFRAISEWDAITSINQAKIPLDFLTFVSGKDDNVITINIYTDGYIEDPVATFTFTIDDVTDTSGLVSVVGKYIMGAGSPDEDSESDKITKNTWNEKFSTYCWEIIEESQNNLVVYDVSTEYVPLEEVYKSTSFAKQIFEV